MAATAEIKADLIDLSKEHAGEWVALHPDTEEFLASGATAMEAIDAARRLGVRDPIIFKPLDDYGGLAPCAP